MYTLLVRHRVRLALYAMLRGRTPASRVLGVLIVALTSLGIGVAIAAGTSVSVRGLARSDPELAHAFLPVLTLSVMAITVLVSIHSLIHDMFKAPDLDLLLAAPVPVRTLFYARLTAVALSGWPGLAFGVASLAGYALAEPVSPLFLLLALPLFLAIVLFAVAVATLLLMAVTRAVPLRLAEKVLVVVSLALSLAVWLGVQWIAIENAPGQLSRTVTTAERWGGSLWLGPGVWAGQALRAVEEHDPATATTRLALIGGATLAAVLLAERVFTRTLVEDRGRLLEAAGRRRSEWRPRRVLPRSGLSPPVQAIALKEWRTLTRDVRLLASLAYPLVTAFVTVLGPGSVADEGGFAVSLLAVPIALLMLGFSLGTTAVGREGRAVALLQLAPVTGRQVIQAKVLTHTAVAVLLTFPLVIVLAVLRHGTPGEAIVGLLMALALSWGAMAASVSAGAFAPRFEAEDPNQAGGCLGQIQSLLAGLPFLTAGSSLAIWILLILRGDATSSAVANVGIAAVILAAVVVTAGIVIAFAGSAAERLDSLEVES